MKKSALALAVAAALVGFGSAAYADTTLYGSARVSVDYDDFDSTYSLVNGNLVRRTVGFDAWDVVNNSSRLGVRGEEDLGGGLSAIYQYEFGVDVTEGGTGFNSNRPKWVGLKGSSWGSLTLGTQWTPYYNVIGIGDIFNSVKVFDNDTFLGNAYALRMDNSVIYSTPNWGGFSAQAMLVMNGSPAQSTNKLTDISDGVDMWNIGVSYKNGPFFIGATYMTLNEGQDVFNVFDEDVDDPDQWGAAIGFNSGPFAVSLAYEDGNVNTLYAGDAKNLYLTGQFTFGNNIIRAAYGFSKPDDDSYITLVNNNPVTIEQSEVNNFALGYQYNFSKRTRVWVEYVGQDVDSDLVGNKQTVSIGTRVDF